MFLVCNVGGLVHSDSVFLVCRVRGLVHSDLYVAGLLRGALHEERAVPVAEQVSVDVPHCQRRHRHRAVRAALALVSERERSVCERQCAYVWVQCVCVREWRESLCGVCVYVCMYVVCVICLCVV